MSGEPPRRYDALGRLHTWVQRGGAGFWRACPDPDPHQLTRRQEEVLDLMVAGLPDKEIARRLGVSDQTVKNHIWQACVRLAAHGRVQAALKWRDVQESERHTEEAP